MFGFGRRNRSFRSNRPGLLGMLFGQTRPRYFGYGRQPQRRGFLSSSLGRMALFGGLSWLGGRLVGGRGNQNPSNGFNTDPGPSTGNWDDNNQSW